MPKETTPIPFSKPELKKHIGKVLLAAGDKFLQDGFDENTKVSEAQIAAFRQSLDALPEGKLKALIEKFSKVQKVSSMMNEGVTTLQDRAWSLIKPFLILEAPIVALIPDKPFAKTAVKSAKLGAKISENLVKTGVKASDKIRSLSKKGHA
jgi:hypothetical protein